MHILFQTYRKERNTQSAAEAIDSHGILYYGSMGDVTLRCFNTKGEYGNHKSSDIISSDSVVLQFPSGMKVSDNSCLFRMEHIKRIKLSCFHKITRFLPDIFENNLVSLLQRFRRSISHMKCSC